MSTEDPSLLGEIGMFIGCRGLGDECKGTGGGVGLSIVRESGQVWGSCQRACYSR